MQLFQAAQDTCRTAALQPAQVGNLALTATPTAGLSNRYKQPSYSSLHKHPLLVGLTSLSGVRCVHLGHMLQANCAPQGGHNFASGNIDIEYQLRFVQMKAPVADELRRSANTPLTISTYWLLREVTLPAGLTFQLGSSPNLCCQSRDCRLRHTPFVVLPSRHMTTALGAAVVVERVKALLQRFNPKHYNSSAQHSTQVPTRQACNRGCDSGLVLASMQSKHVEYRSSHRLMYVSTHDHRH